MLLANDLVEATKDRQASPADRVATDERWWQCRHHFAWHARVDLGESWPGVRREHRSAAAATLVVGGYLVVRFLMERRSYVLPHATT
jgi:hypothetical protein